MNISKSLKTGVIALSLMFGVTSAAHAVMSPKAFSTKNYTPYQSNAKVKNVWSPFATPAGTSASPAERSVPWLGLRMLCGITATTCSAEIWMKTDTDNPVFVADGSIDVSTGVISPSEMINNGFKLTSTEPGMIEIREVE